MQAVVAVHLAVAAVQAVAARAVQAGLTVLLVQLTQAAEQVVAIQQEITQVLLAVQV
jgi:hypothetical protein